MVKIICDAGSCHNGRIEYAKELIETASLSGADAIKFQLFKKQNVGGENIELPREWWPELVDYAKTVGIEISASAFDWEAIELLKKYNAPWIKFAHSCRTSPNVKYVALTMPVIVSCDPLDVQLFEGSNFTRLFCVPEYPVLYQIDFSEIFTRYPFDGFSDHTLGYGQTLNAVLSDAQIIEKHITLDHADIDCPDHYFALRPHELEDMVSKIRELK